MPKQSEGQMNRIEEVKKILEHYFSEELGEGVSDDIAEEIRQLFTQPLEEEALEITKQAHLDMYGDIGSKPQPLDDEELEEKWEDTVIVMLPIPTDKRKVVDAVKTQAKITWGKALALLQPKIEEAIKQEKIEAFARLCNMPEAEGYDWVMSKEALVWLYMMRTNAECQRIIWQALEGDTTNG